MKSLFKLALILIVAVVVYNYFFGTTEERQQSERIVSEVKDLGKSAWNLLKSEKEKFDAGKYDDAVNKIGDLIASLKEKAETVQDSGILDDIAQLERKRDELERRIERNKVEEYGVGDDGLRDEEADRIKNDWDELLKDTENLMNRMERN